MNLSSIDQCSLRILCLDPDSCKLYSSLVEYDKDPEIIVYEDQDLPYNMIEKKSKTIEIINILCEFKEWNFDTKQIQAYRKRKLPLYLIKKVFCKYPQYISKSKLSEAFSSTSDLDLDISLEKYRHQIITPEMKYMLEALDQKIKLRIQVKAELVSSAKQLIKHIISKVYEKFKVKLKCSKNQQFCLKVDGFEDYIYGDTQFMNFNQARQMMRGFQGVQFVLMEIDKKPQNQCPYLYDKSISFIEWQILKDEELFVWYSPVDLKEREQKKEQEKEQVISINFGQRTLKKDVEYIMEFNYQRAIEKNIKGVMAKEEKYTGEEEANFIFSIVSIDNLKNIMKMNKKNLQEVTDNGIQEQQYVTYQQQDQFINQLMDIKIGKNSNFKLQNLMSYFNKTNINNTQIVINCFIYYGDTQLIKNQKKEAYIQIVKDYNDVQIIINEEKEVKNLQLNQLPLESRLCFEISIQSKVSFWSRIIGCCSSNLFDEQGRMNQGEIVMNIWPFYKLEPRISCFSQFQAQLPNLAYSTLKISLYSQSSPIHWTMKDFLFTHLSQPIKQNHQLFNQQQISIEINHDLNINLNDKKSLKEIIGQKLLGGSQSLQQQQEKKQISFFELIKSIVQLKQNNEDNSNQKCEEWKKEPDLTEISELKGIFQKDHLALLNLSQQEKKTLLKCRKNYMSMSKGLVFLLRAIDWTQVEQVWELYQLLPQWSLLDPQDALILLDSYFADETVRLYAVQRISDFHDDQLVLYMLQLVQALQFETTLFSPLAEFLIQRSLNNPFVVGHEFFWQLRSYLVFKLTYTRFSIILQQFVMLSGYFRVILYHELTANNIIAQVSKDVMREIKLSKENDLKYRNEVLRDQLKKVQNRQLNQKFPKQFLMSIDPRITITKINNEECLLFSSKKMPLNLSLQKISEGQKEQKIRTIFKTGDDLRMDMVAIQLIRIMDQLWLQAGLDLRMKPYKVISTWDQVGMIEMVPNSATISDIHSQFGGKTGALDRKTIMKYLMKHNNDNFKLIKAQDNFIRSCAGYCVATFIMGVGDRHNGNIMVAESGHLFHIDFGHFLGNFKSKFGFKRERTFFVYSREMDYVINYNSEVNNFNLFQQYCTKGYNILREHGNVIIDMFLMMLSAGMPELTKKEDIHYLKDRLEFELTMNEAEEMFKNEIQRSKKDIVRVFDNQIHNMKHNKNNTVKKKTSIPTLDHTHTDNNNNNNTYNTNNINNTKL